MSRALDRRSRPLRDLRISVTDRCNFRCTYRMPKETFGRDFAFLPRDQLLTFEEIARLARAFAREGVTKIRLTGSEPLLRRDLEHCLTQIAEHFRGRGHILRVIEYMDIGTSNGWRMDDVVPARRHHHRDQRAMAG